MEILDKAGLTYFWSMLKAFITKDYDRTISRGEQLVTNGSAMMGDNTNFSSWSYDGAEAFNSSGSFTRAQDTTRPMLLSDDYFPVNPVNTYELSVAAKSLNGLTRLYSMPVFFDADKREISSQTHMYRPNTLTTLAQELKNGDTVVHLTDLTNWDVNTATRTYQRGFIFWNYKNSFGYEYPENTYSRNVYYNLYPDANVNKTAKTITLTSPWNKGTFPAGTKVSQCDDGLTYKYVGWVNTTVTTEWITRAGLISGVDFSGRNDTSKFPPATAYCRIGFYWNYNQANDKTWITNVSFKEVLVPASSTPLMDGTAAVGTSLKYAREDHRHPPDTNKVDKESGKGLSTNDFTDALKTKLDGVATGAEVNQNAFSNVVVGSTTIAADGKTDTLTLVAGSNVTLTPDATNDKVTIAATDTTYSAATQSAAGLMSASDKTKLNGIDDGAEVNQNAYGKVGAYNSTGSVLYSDTANAKTDTMVLLEGTNVELSSETMYLGGEYVNALKISANDPAYDTMTQAQANAGTSTDGKLISPKVLNDTIAGKVGTNFTETSGSTVSAANDAWTKVQSVTLEAGTYLVKFGVSFASNATGYRSICLTVGSETATLDRYAPTQNAVSGRATDMMDTEVVVLTAQTTVNVHAFHTAGTALNTYPFIKTLKLK